MSANPWIARLESLARADTPGLVSLLSCRAARGLALLLLLPSAALSSDELLERAKRNMVERLDTALNFTCQLEVERAVYPNAAASRFLSRDRSRLEVGVVEGRELFAWPGDQFKDRPLTDFFGPGIATTGEFSQHGGAIFTDSRVEIERSADDSQEKRVAYNFRVAAEDSEYVLSSGDESFTAGYEGTFYVDEASAQVLRLELHVPRPPSSSGLTRVGTEIDYGRSSLGSAVAWLPVKALIEVETAGGTVARNRLAFRDCRSFQVDTSLRFDARDELAPAVKSAADLVVIPAGLDLPLELSSAIGSDFSWAGDRFTAIVYKHVKSEGEIVLPKGAQVRGRLVGLETINATLGPKSKNIVQWMTVISLALTEVRWDSRCAPLTATMRLVERIPVMSRIDPSGASDYNDARISTNQARTYDTRTRLSQPGLGTFVVHGELYLIRKGMRMRWTVEPSSGNPCREGQSGPSR